MFVTNWISTTKIQKISEITNFFRHYFLSRTEVKAINNINVRQNLTLMYSIDEKGQKFAVHTKRQCLLIPQIPQIENYMAAMLTGFFDVQRSFKEEYDRLRLEEANAKV